MEPKPDQLINNPTKIIFPGGYRLEDAADLTPDQYKMATLLFPVKPEQALVGISQIAERMGKSITWVSENRTALSWKLWYENDRIQQGTEQKTQTAEEIPPAKALLLQRLDHIPVYSNTSMRERDSLMWFDLTPKQLEERRNQMLASDPQSTISFKETLNSQEVDPMDPKLTLPEVLRLLYDLQKQDDAKTQIKWRTPENVAIARQVALDNGILERVYSSLINLTPNIPENHTLGDIVAGRLFNELAIIYQRAQLPSELTLLSDTRTLAFYNRLHVDSRVNLISGLEMAGLVRDTEDGDGNLNLRGISLPDAIAVKEDDSGNLSIAEIHEYSTRTRRLDRVRRKYKSHRELSSLQAPDLLPKDATFVFVALNQSDRDAVSLNILRKFPDALVRSQTLGLNSRQYSSFITDFIINYRPNPQAQTLDELTTLQALRGLALR